MTFAEELRKEIEADKEALSAPNSIETPVKAFQYAPAEQGGGESFSEFLKRDIAQDKESLAKYELPEDYVDEVKKGLNETDVLGWEEAPDWLKAGIKGFQDMSLDSYRGISQLSGVDDPEWKQEHEYMKALYDSDYGLSIPAYIGAGIGLFADPVAWGTFGVGRIVQGAKAVKKGVELFSKTKVGKSIEELSDVQKTTAAAGVGGAAWSGIAYTPEEESRPENMLVGGLTATALGYGVSKVYRHYKNKADLKKAVKEASEIDDAVKDFEWNLGSLVNDGGLTVEEAIAKIVKEKPELSSRVQKAAESGVYVNPKRAIDNYEIGELVETGLYTPDTVPASMRLKEGFLKELDKAIGSIRTRISEIDPKAGGSLGKFEAALLIRPEKYVRQRQAFADYFPSLTGVKQLDPSVTKYTEEETMSLNKLLLNGKFDEAEDFLLKTRGKGAVEAFRSANKVLKELGDEMYNLGIINKKLDNYWPRAIARSRFDDFREALLELSKKDAGSAVKVLSKDLQKDWDALLIEKNTELMASRGWRMSPYEEAQLFQRTFLKEWGDRSYFSFGKGRKIKDIPDPLVKFYESPIEAFDSHIHNSVRQIEMAKLFGQKSYAQGLVEDGVFDLNKAIDSSSLLKNVSDDVLAKEELRQLLKVRFGPGMATTGDYTSTYKAIVNTTLLANPISAAIQFGDLGSAMWNNGIWRSTKAFVRSVGGDDSRMKLGDFGLEPMSTRAAEFEDVNIGKARAIQDWAMKWSGFQAVDRFGKETILNSALEKGQEYAKGALVSPMSKLKARNWEKRYRKAWGNNEFESLKQELASFKKGDEPSDRLMAYLLTELENLQPITKSSTPEYFHSNAKVFYTLKTFMLKQMDVWRRRIIQPLIHGDAEEKAEAAVDLGRYVVLLGSMNMGAEWIGSEILGDPEKNPFSEMPELTSSYAFGELIKALGLSSIKVFGMSEYTLGQIHREGIEGYIKTLLPPMPIVAELGTAAAQGSASDKDIEDIYESQIRSMLRYFPIIGRNVEAGYIPFLLDERDKTYSAPELPRGEPLPRFAEGGLVEPMTESPVTEAAKPSQAIPETAHVPVVDEAPAQEEQPQESVEEMQARMTEPSPGKEGMVHEPAPIVTEEASKPFEFVEDVIQAAPEVWDSLNLMEKLALVSAPVPVVGDLLGLGSDISTYISDEDSNTWTNYGLTALGVLPFIPNMSLGIKIVDKNKRTRSVEKLIKEGKSPFEGKEFDYWRGVEKGTIDLAQKRPREVGEHATTHLSLAKRFAEEQADRGKTGTVYHRKATLNKGVVIKDTDIHNAPKTVEKLLQHKDFQDEESQKLLRMIGLKYNQRMRIINDLPDSLLDRIDSEKARLDEVYGRFVRDFLTNRGYDHIAYVNVAEKLRSGNYDVSLAFLKPDDWNETAMQVKPVKGYAEGGSVEQPSSTPIEEKPKMEKLDPGLYQDDTGKLFHVDSEGKVKDMKDIVSAFKN